MNAQLTETSAPPKRINTIYKPSKRLVGWGLPIGVTQLEGVQKMHDVRCDLNFLHRCMQMAPWFNGKSDAPVTADRNVGHALYHYNLPCGAKLAIWVPTAVDSDGKLAVYMTDCAGKHDVPDRECSQVLLEIRVAMGG